jgi:hypothetical protein
MVQALIARPVADTCSRRLGAQLLNRAPKHSSQLTKHPAWAATLVILADDALVAQDRLCA